MSAVPPSPNIFHGAELAIAVTVFVAATAPFAFHFSKPRHQRDEIPRGFIWAVVAVTVPLAAYLIADLAQGVFNQQNVWFALVMATILLLALAAQTVRVSRRAVPSASDLTNLVSDLPRDAVTVCSSSAEFARVILAIEEAAPTIDRMAKRVSAIFKDPVAVADIAARRFGPGSKQAKAYLTEHRERRRVFVERQSQGQLTCREIYQREELLRYARSRTHGIGIVLDRQVLRRTVEDWLDCIRKYDNYLVALTEDPIPLKYQIFDETKVVLHEAAGSLDAQRLNAIVIESESALAAFQADFDNVWERVPAAGRSKRVIEEFIVSEILPVLSDGDPE